MAYFDIIPPTLRARHHETGEWHVLECCFYADDDFWRITNTNPVTSYVYEGLEEHPADLHDFDRFEGVVS